MADKVITDELAERVERLLGEYAANITGFSPVTVPGEGQAFARRARELGVALVDPNRQRFLVDETVHAGVLFRLREAEAEVRRLNGGGVDELSGEYSDT